MSTPGRQRAARIPGVLHGGRDSLAGAEASLISVRRAAADDRAALTGMFERCTLETRYRRFHGPVKAIPERYLAEALSGSPFHYALVACLEAEQGAGPGTVAEQGAPAGGIVALASCRVVDEGAAELGILIEDAWQRHGLGRRLLRDLATHAAGSGLRVLQAQLLAEQGWATAILRPYGPCRLSSAGAGILHVTVRLVPLGPYPYRSGTIGEAARSVRRPGDTAGTG